MANANHLAGGANYRSTWWLGPLGVFLGFVVALIYIVMSVLWLFPGLFLIVMLVVPAASGYAFRAFIRRTPRATFSSLGTAVGWMLFIVLLLGNPGGLGFMLLMLPQLLFGPGAIVVYALVALGFVLVFQELASRVVRRVQGS